MVSLACTVVEDCRAGEEGRGGGKGGKKRREIGGKGRKGGGEKTCKQEIFTLATVSKTATNSDVVFDPSQPPICTHGVS